MSEETGSKVQGVTYQDTHVDYFNDRQLVRSGTYLGLWGLGIAAVISGNFSGWNFGLLEAGWGGMLVATIIITIMYFGMVFSIGEMAAALPHTGGAYSFARSAMGPVGGFVTGLAETIEYVATTAVIVFFSAAYADAITAEFGLSLPVWLWWIILYALFLILNIAGAEISFKFAIVVSFLSLAVLAIFAVMAVTADSFSLSQFNNITPDEGMSAFLPKGWMGVIYALPFAMWFYLGIEELPLAAEEAHTPARDIPRAGVWGMVTLTITAFLVLTLNPAVTGSDAIKESGEPLLDGFRAIIPNANVAALLASFALIGLLASLQGIMFAYGRNIFSLSRSGYYPKFLSLTGARKTPYVALIAGAVLGYLSLIITEYSGSDTAGAVVLNIAVWGAVIAYILQMLSFVLLRRNLPNVDRPYRSPVGVLGAVVAGLLSVLVFIGQLLNVALRPAIGAIAVVYLIGLVYFGFVSRHRLVKSPEEHYALSHGGKNKPAGA